MSVIKSTRVHLNVKKINRSNDICAFLRSRALDNNQNSVVTVAELHTFMQSISAHHLFYRLSTYLYDIEKYERRFVNESLIKRYYENKKLVAVELLHADTFNDVGVRIAESMYRKSDENVTVSAVKRFVSERRKFRMRKINLDKLRVNFAAFVQQYEQDEAKRLELESKLAKVIDVDESSEIVSDEDLMHLANDLEFANLLDELKIAA